MEEAESIRVLMKGCVEDGVGLLGVSLFERKEGLYRMENEQFCVAYSGEEQSKSRMSVYLVECYQQVRDVEYDQIMF